MGASVQSSSKGTQRGGQRRGRGRRRSQPMAEINVTPFVDVMLVLLIIFMVSAPLMTVGVPVELPKTAAGALPGEDEEPLTVTMRADGGIEIQTTEVEREALVSRLRAIAAERTSDQVFLRADGAIAYRDVMQVMGALNAGGFSNVGLVTDTGGPALDGETDGTPGATPGATSGATPGATSGATPGATSGPVAPVSE